MDARLYPIEQNSFKSLIQPIIEKSYIWKGRPADNKSLSSILCNIICIKEWNSVEGDLPKCFGSWHTIYTRFHRGNEKSLWWKILLRLQQQKKIKMNVVLCDSSSFKLHRHGSGLKKGSNQKAEAFLG